MVQFTVNGKRVQSEKGSRKLLPFLRDELRLTSVKDGCSEGGCGTCTVIIDGKAVRACIPTLAKLEGKAVVTTEGLTAREKDVFGYCFAKTGAVQCGFCIPGMVMSAKALIDANPSPSGVDVKKAIRGNICRCTGYVKIEEAILKAAEFFRKNKAIPQESHTGRLGEDFPRVDAVEKTLGTGEYTDDVVVEGMVYGKALRTKYPRAGVLAIRKGRAEAHPDCIKIITAADIPGSNKCGHLVKDWDALIAVGGITRYVGDSIAIAVTKTREALDEVLALVEVDYEELKPTTSPKEALAEGAPLIHQSGNLLKQEVLKRGNVEEAFKNAAHIVTRHYSVPFTEHACMEPECAIAMPEGDGLLLYTGSQSIFDEQREIAGLLGIPDEKVRVRSKLVGGGFGGKEDMSVQHHAALAAWLVKKPVKVKFSRQESIRIHPKRHAMEMDFSTACDKDGKILALKAEITADTGAYASLGGPVLQRACTHAGGPYSFRNIEITGKAVYTNNPPAGAFRGFGVTQSAFAFEMNLNELAEKVGISPWEIRYRNAVRPGQILPNGQLADDSTAMAECLLAVKDIYEKAPYAGIAACFKNSGLGVGVPDTGRCIISVEGGKVHVRTSAACIGQGIATVMTQMVCETLEITPDMVVVEAPDTARTPNSGTTTASRQTVFTGEAAIIAAKKLKPELDSGKTLSNLEGQEFYGEYKPVTDPMGSEKTFPVSHVAYGYAAQVVELDQDGRLKKVTAAYDIGTLVNPKSAEGQIEGGVVMGLGYGLTEDYPLESCIPKAKYGTLGLFRATEVPPIDVIFVKKDAKLEAAYGSKGVGELATIPTAPAIAGAYLKLDGKFRARLPLDDTPYTNFPMKNK